MINLEWLKSIHSILSQVLELSDNNPAFGNWMEFATKAARQISNSLSIPYTPPFFQDDQDEEPHSPTAASNGSEDKATAQSEATNPLGILEMVNHALKQAAVLEPFLRNLLKDQSIAGPLTESPSAAGAGTTGRSYINNSFLSSLLGVLMPVFLLIFIFRNR